MLCPEYSGRAGQYCGYYYPGPLWHQNVLFSFTWNLFNYPKHLQNISQLIGAEWSTYASVN